MNEFEWRRQMRELRGPVAPRRDLWLDIEPTLERPPGRRSSAGTRASPVPTWLLAASFAGVTLLAVSLGLRQRDSLAGPALAAHITAGAAWKPEDPRLAGAAIELDAARMELRQAMSQAPDSPALQRLLRRTQQQQSWLRHLDRAS